MPSPTVSMREQMMRRRPVAGALVAHGASSQLKRTIGTFQLTLFGVGATVGTGIFFVLADAVPEAGPAVLVSFLLAGVAAGAAEWLDGDILALGTSARGGIAGVFLGSRGTKIVRHSPVPVLVLPA